MQKIKRDLNGSFTVEAALLMTVLIPLLTALIYLGSGGVKRGKNKVAATGKATFRIPGFVARFFMGGQMEINSKAEVSVKNAKKQIQKYRNLQRAGEG